MLPLRSKGAPKTRSAPRRKPARKAVVRPRPARVAPLKDDQLVAEAATAMAATATEKLEACWQSVLDQNSAECVHKFRVALRQLRVLLHVFRKLEPSDRIDDFRQALARFALAAGRQRDLDVRIEDIIAPLGAIVNGVDLSGLVEILEKERQQVRGDVVREFDSQGARALRRQLADLPQQLGSWVAAVDHKGTVGKFSRRELKHYWRKLERGSGNLKSMDANELHEMRKGLKRLRYTFGYFSPIWPEQTAAQFEKRMQRLQATLGYLNDVENTKRLTDRLKVDVLPPEIALAIGYVAGSQVDRAQSVRGKISKQWRKLAATEVGLELSGE